MLVPSLRKNGMAILLDGRSQELLNPTDSLINYQEPHHQSNNKLKIGLSSFVSESLLHLLVNSRKHKAL